MIFDAYSIVWPSSAGVTLTAVITKNKGEFMPYRFSSFLMQPKSRFNSSQV
jgi:hypothetical protein